MLVSIQVWREREEEKGKKDKKGVNTQQQDMTVDYYATSLLCVNKRGLPERSW